MVSRGYKYATFLGKSEKHCAISVVNVIKIYTKKGIKKRDKWSSSRIFTTIVTPGGTVIALGYHDHAMKAAFEDNFASIQFFSLA